MNLIFESFEAARSHVLGFGPVVEVLEPVELRDSVIEQATKIALSILQWWPSGPFTGLGRGQQLSRWQTFGEVGEARGGACKHSQNLLKG